MVHYQKIVVAFDGSENGLKALDSAKALAAGQQAHLIVLYVEKAAFKYPISTGRTSRGEQYMFHANANKENDVKWGKSATNDTDEHIAENEVATLAMNLAKNKLTDLPNVSYEHVIGSPAAMITAFATENNMDMIIVGHRGLGALRKWYLGSVSKEVTDNARCSVLIVK